MTLRFPTHLGLVVPWCGLHSYNADFMPNLTHLESSPCKGTSSSCAKYCTLSTGIFIWRSLRLRIAIRPQKRSTEVPLVCSSDGAAMRFKTPEGRQLSVCAVLSPTAWTRKLLRILTERNAYDCRIQRGCFALRKSRIARAKRPVPSRRSEPGSGVGLVSVEIVKPLMPSRVLVRLNVAGVLA